MQNKYEVIGIVGEGAYGIVYKCRCKDDNSYVAIKKFKETEDEIVKKTMKRELRVLKILKHENIVEFKEAFKKKQNLFLVFEYIEKNLLELLQEHPRGLDPNLIKRIIFQACKAIKYLHDINLIHRDLKPENILVDKDYKIKLCDFGFARTFKSQREQLTDYVATRWYRSPELLITAGYYGPEVDYWAIGCIMGELTDGDPLFPGDNELDQLHVIQKIMGRLPDELIELFYKNPHFHGLKLMEVKKPETLERRYMGKLSKVAIGFLKSLLSLDPKQRLRGDDVLNHPYFEDLIERKIKKQTSIRSGSSTQYVPLETKSDHREEKTEAFSKQSTVREDLINLEQKNAFKKEIPANLIKETSKTTRTQPILTNEDSQIKLNIPKKQVAPLINSTTNINIINYNNYDPSSEQEKRFSKGNIGTKTLTNFMKNDDKKTNSDNNLSLVKQAANHFVQKPTNQENMLMTSYNFNKHMNDDIKSIYNGSYNLSTNFKTFYKGDKYNYDIGEVNTFRKNNTSEKPPTTQQSKYEDNNNINNMIEEKKSRSVVPTTQNSKNKVINPTINPNLTIVKFKGDNQYSNNGISETIENKHSPSNKSKKFMETKFKPIIEEGYKGTSPNKYPIKPKYNIQLPSIISNKNQMKKYLK